MLRGNLSVAEIDAGGGSNTDDEEEPYYNVVVFHLTHQNDPPSEDPTIEMESSTADSEETPDSKGTDEDTSASREMDPIPEKHVSKHNILFQLQHDFVFECLSDMEDVFVARSRHGNDTKLALKIVRDKRCNRTNGYVPMELRVLGLLRTVHDPTNTHLQQMHAFLLHDCAYAFFSPYATNLLELYKTRDFSKNPLEIRRIMQQLLIALRNLHALHVIHRDVKHSNILWENDHLTLIDYDLATWDSPGRKHYDEQGTPGFIAPEVLAFKRDSEHSASYYDSKIDIYSAGVLFGCLLFNVPENDISEIYVRAFRQHAARLLPDQPLVVNLLLYMIEIEPARRPAAHLLLQHDYFRGC